MENRNPVQLGTITLKERREQILKNLLLTSFYQLQQMDQGSTLKNT